MALLSTQIVSTTGITVTFAAAAVGGDTFSPASQVFIRIKNGGGSPITATVVSPVPCSQGFNHDLAVTIAAAGEQTIGPFPPGRFAGANGQASITYSGVTSVTVAAVQLPAAQG